MYSFYCTRLTSTCPWYSTEISDTLIAENASLIAKNINDESPLHVAIRNNNPVAVSFFLEKGIDPNLYICNGNSLASFCELIDDDYEIGRMINVYLVKQAAIKAITLYTSPKSY